VDEQTIPDIVAFGGSAACPTCGSWISPPRVTTSQPLPDGWAHTIAMRCGCGTVLESVVESNL